MAGNRTDVQNVVASLCVYMVESAPEGTPGPGTATVATLRAKFAPIDDRLGPILDELDALRVADRTAVVFHGDHGWQLGEHNRWHKFTNFELATRVP